MNSRLARLAALEATHNTQSSNASTQYQRAVLASMSTPDLWSLRSAIVDGSTPIAKQIWQQAQKEVSNNG